MSECANFPNWSLLPYQNGIQTNLVNILWLCHWQLNDIIPILPNYFISHQDYQKMTITKHMKTFYESQPNVILSQLPIFILKVKTCRPLALLGSYWHNWYGHKRNLITLKDLFSLSKSTMKILCIPNRHETQLNQPMSNIHMQECTPYPWGIKSYRNNNTAITKG